MKSFLHENSKTICAAILAALVFCVFDSTVPAQKTNKNKSESFSRVSVDFGADEMRILALVNAERTKRGLKALAFDEKVSDIARDYSEKMARENFFSHYDADGKSVLERAQKARLKHWSKVGENLFSVEGLADFAAFAVKNWMKSAAHRQNILDPEWTTGGGGVAKSRTGEIFITQVFIKR